MRYTEHGARYYIHPTTGERHVSATTIASVVDKGFRFDAWTDQQRKEDMRALARALIDASGTYANLDAIAAEHIERPGTAEQIRSSTAHFGTMVHRWIDAAIKTKQLDRDTSRLPTRYRDHCAAFVRLCQRHHVDATHGDTVLYGHIAGYPVAGALDAYGTVNGRRGIIDIKTTNSLHKTMGIQLGIYRMLWEQNNGRDADVDGIFIVHIPRKHPEYARIYEIAYEPDIVEMAVKMWFWRDGKSTWRQL